ncbi:MAG: hypothetical protein JSV86_07985 [Gemmatimonadota bacterium]|nr:MAG: hypothetical protein JSV86_07985 [Gemmatimonadota bacterium]
MGPWDPAVIGPIAGAVMVIAITAGVASVAIFRPFTRQLGELLEQMRRDRQQQADQVSPARMTELMESMLDRLERIEARQDFAERVLESAGWKGEAGPLPARRAKGERRGRTGGS